MYGQYFTVILPSHAIREVYGIEGCLYSWLAKEQARVTDPSLRSHATLHSMQMSRTMAATTSIPPPDPSVS